MDIAAVQIQQQIRLRIDRLPDGRRDPRRRVAGRVAGKGPVQIASAVRHQLPRAGIEAAGICQRNQQQPAPQRAGLHAFIQTAHRLDPRIFAAVDAGRHRQRRPFLSAAHQPEGQVRSARRRQTPPGLAPR